MEISAARLQTIPRRALPHRPPFHAPTRYALLQAHGKVQCPSIRSVTRSGIRLDGAFGLCAGEAVTVRLPSEKTVSGTVDWTVAGFCGIAFAEPLAEDDPALSEA
ncbi:MAG: hypothetical protein ACK4TP_16370 [Hyphomicrobium sp.]|jgi:hypothetical protein